ncbi:MAG: hypothetical protein H7A46_25075 [Verrucomicrobiales bacterium]|nr:hypothetical protein [Verrucomicrobiales bacterium]
MTIQASQLRLALSLGFVLFGCLPALTETNQLAQLLSTTRAGQYRLTQAWVGERRQTVATGFFATHTNSPALERSERELHLDLFSYYNEPSAMPLGSRAISQSLEQTKEGWRHTNLHIHRAAFPTDAEVTAARTVGALTNLLGSSWGFKDAWGDTRAMHSQAGWSYFRMVDDATLETLSVFCLTTYTNGQSAEYVDSIRIQRGTARQAR